MATLGGPAIPVSVQTGGTVQGGPAIPVAVVTDGRATQGGPAVAVQVVTSGPVQGGPALPVVAAPAGARVAAGPAIKVYVVSGSLGGVSAPVNLTVPTISGTVAVGQTLTATTGTWSNSPTSYAYQWKQNGVAIGGATASTYVLTSSDPGTTITVTVTATNAAGSASATSAGTSVPALLGSLVAYFQLEEASGTRVDATGRGNDLAPTNTPGNTTGRVGNALQCVSASSQYLSRADTADLSGGDLDLTWCCWVYLDSKTNRRQIFSKYSAAAGNREYACRYDAASDRFHVDATSDGTTNVFVRADTFGSPPTATWCFIMVQYLAAADTIGISVNAGTIDTAALAGGIANGTNPFYIGHNDASSGDMDGRIDEWGMWRRALSGAEITTLYNGGNGRTYPFVGT